MQSIISLVNVRKEGRGKRQQTNNVITRTFSSTEDASIVHIAETEIRHKPECLEELCRLTKFSKKELQIIYRGFKQECPSGVVKEGTFQQIYAQFFPQGDSNLYAHYVFNVFDQDQDGTVSFEEFVCGLSLLARGSNEEKLRWIFSLYDLNRDGLVSRDEMLGIVTSVYLLIGPTNHQTVDDVMARDHVENMFKKMDADRDGFIAVDEFMKACIADESIFKSLGVFDTVL